MTRKTPGVYIEEISTLPASIAPVATAIPAFIGYTEIAVKGGENLANVPTRITSMLEYEQYFGRGKNAAFDIKINDVYDGANLASRSLQVDLVTEPAHILYYAVQHYFANGGGPCYIVSVGNYSASIDKGKLKEGILATEKVDEPTLYVFPDAVNLAQSDYAEVVRDALKMCNKLQDRFTIADAVDVENAGKLDLVKVDKFRTALGASYLKYGAVYYPFLKTTINYGFAYDDASQKVTHTRTGGTPPAGHINHDGKKLKEVDELEPGLFRQIRARINEYYVTLPPSPAMAGIYARVDAERGVWKAPANVGLRSVIAPTIRITNADQENLNVDPGSGKSVNAIRAFAGKGILVWGARTLAGNDNEWRYVPVRRLYIFVEESVKKATEFVVFEPNDAKTWVRVKAMIENFLTGLWREGALAGASPKEAFFVHVGLGQTMTADDILNGIMNIEIGMAAVRPAEFIILKFSHKLQES